MIHLDVVNRAALGVRHLTSHLQTQRLVLRYWRPTDRAPFAALNADLRVMEHFPAPLSATESEALADRIEAHFSDHGFGLWAVEIPGVVEFAGFIGLKRPHLPPPFEPKVEIAWRLVHAVWGRGYAQEGARAVLRHGFDSLGLEDIVSLTAATNLRSRRVMTAIGMTFAEAFEHPGVPDGHVLKPHVLFRMQKPAGD